MIGAPPWTSRAGSAGQTRAFPPTSAYSAAHYEAVGGALANLDRYNTIFVDSITEIARLSFRHAEQQPEAISERTGNEGHPRRLTACMAGRWCIGCSNCSTRAERTSSSSPCLNASSTSSTASSNGARNSKAARPGASSPPSSIRSSPCSGSTSAMASLCAPSCVRRQTRGAIPPRIAAVGSNNSSRPTSAN